MFNDIQMPNGELAPFLKMASTSNETSVRKLHFSSANGLPSGCYLSFLEQFTEKYSVTSMENRGAWPHQAKPKFGFQWHHHADDLIAAIESQHTQAVIGVGHSIGAAITAIAASKRPDLFSHIVLIDSASMTSQLMVNLSNPMPQWLSFKVLKFIERTHNRKSVWPSRKAFFDNYRNHPTYKNFTEASFKDYVQHGLFERDDGQFQLVYNPHWESYNFRKIAFLWSALKKVNTPTLLLRAENTYMYSQEKFDKLNANLSSNIQPAIIPNAGHLAPLEQPEQLARQIRAWLDANQ